MEELSVQPIRLFFAENKFSGHLGSTEQYITFGIRVANLAFEKAVDVHWAGPDGVWHVSAANFVRSSPDGELWEAAATYDRPAGHEIQPRPTVHFALRLRAGGREWWDNNDGANYSLVGSDALCIGPGVKVCALQPSAKIGSGRTHYDVRVAVRDSLHARAVNVRWTTDRWRTQNSSACHLRSHRRSRRVAGGAAPASAWTATLPVASALRVEYAIACETGDGTTLWDNNGGANYVAARERLKVLTLNLHCYEEENWEAKFWQIARAINDHDVDIVCLQEVAEPWNNGQGDAGSNAARIIRDRLNQHYHLVMDWSHLGFGRYREGSAILSRYDIAVKDSGYVSHSRDPFDIHARKVVMAQLQVPALGPVNVFSTHLSWWADGFRTQFENLRRWADERHTTGIAATLLCGDFNSEPSSEGYRVATRGGDYEDQFLKAHRKAGLNGDVAAGTDRRIDYIFLKKGSTLEAVASKALFTPADYGTVSDHPGYYAEFEAAG